MVPETSCEILSALHECSTPSNLHVDTKCHTRALTDCLNQGTALSQHCKLAPFMGGSCIFGEFSVHTEERVKKLLEIDVFQKPP